MKDLAKVRTFDQVDLRHSVIRNLLGTLRDMWQRTLTLGGPWSSLVGGEGSYLPNCQKIHCLYCFVSL